MVPSGHLGSCLRHGLTALTLALVLAAGDASLSASEAHADHATAEGHAAGAFVPWGFNDAWFGCPPPNQGCNDEAIGMAGRIQPPGMSTARFKVPWHVVQPNGPDEWSWDRPDAVHAAMRAAGMRPILQLTTSPDWARVPADGGDPDPTALTGPPQPRFHREYREFVIEAVNRYPDVIAIEVWNEPNHPTYWANPDPAENGEEPSPDLYVELLQQARIAINASGSGAPVVFAGLGGGGSGDAPPGGLTAARFLRESYRSDAAEDPAALFDGIAIHPYPTPPASGVEPASRADWATEMWEEIRRVEAVRDEEDPGSAACLWITEVGVPGRWVEPFGLFIGAGVPAETEQAAILTELYASLYDHQCVESFVIHSFSLQQNGWWGAMYVVSPPWLGAEGAGTPRPAYCVLGERIGTPAC